MQEHADAIKLGSSMSSCLPLLVFQHRRHHSQEEEDEEEDVDNEMLMFSVSKQSLHKNMEQGLLAVGDSSSMCWTTPQGWILLARALDPNVEVSSACLWNPSTGDKLPLPDIITEEHEISYHSTSSPTRTQLLAQDASSCSLAIKRLISGIVTPLVTAARTIGDINPTTLITVVLYPGHQRGKRHVVLSVLSRESSPKWLPSEGKSTSTKTTICAIDFSSCTSSTTNNHNRPRFQKFNFPFVDLPEDLSSRKQWLVESQDQLFAVTMGFIAFNPNNIGAVEVYRMDSSTSTTQACWRRVHDIGNVVFLLEEEIMAASCSASALGLKANQIFFMKNIIDDDADLCIFYLETNTQEIT